MAETTELKAKLAEIENEYDPLRAEQDKLTAALEADIPDVLREKAQREHEKNAKRLERLFKAAESVQREIDEIEKFAPLVDAFGTLELGANGVDGVPKGPVTIESAKQKLADLKMRSAKLFGRKAALETLVHEAEQRGIASADLGSVRFVPSDDGQSVTLTLGNGGGRGGGARGPKPVYYTITMVGKHANRLENKTVSGRSRGEWAESCDFASFKEIIEKYGTNEDKKKLTEGKGTRSAHEIFRSSFEATTEPTYESDLESDEAVEPAASAPV